ncbi:MAG: hypothetical protein A2527_01280 [Candidatus Lambdaproteobacteria bacterium RIFOXYD2_FULL_50_16]|uniref:Ferrous iron transporter FeoA-like domain-containing protein n=1 Tax=Candidatus Lambdaproteobacteria bacterium RIFOXYD2_FULL_50_16 TaxID=1817772 RepID=A0A1F6GEL0_9PROT|nr:MAG: hypothetical protein A2527_01280 [Candidatus Lambdaproteobacteria bacterium RIFOXYD2_FULL_50_16]
MEPVSLSLALLGQRMQIVSLTADPRRIERLRGLGFGRGRILSVIKREASGILILGFEGNGQRIAIAPEIAQEIQVRPFGGDQ